MPTFAAVKVSLADLSPQKDNQIDKRIIKTQMKKIILTSIVLVATLPLMAEGIDAVADSSRVHDLDEVVVVSQPKESSCCASNP